MGFYAQIPMWGSGSPHIQKQAVLAYQLGILQFTSFLTLSSHRQHQTPQIKGSVLYDDPPFRHQSPPVLLTN